MSEQTERSEKPGKDEKDQKRKKIIIGIIIVLLLIAIIILLILLLKKPEENESRGSVRLVEDEQTAANVMEDMREEVAKGIFECSMSMDWTFPDGKSNSTDAYVANSTANKYPIYFDVILDDTQEVIYSSPVLPVGAKLTDFALDKELAAGKYKATVMYTLVEDVETQKEISQAGFVVNIEVLN